MYQHDPLTQKIIGCGIEVHRQLGPGLLEATYEEALCVELSDANLCYVRQVPVPLFYKGRLIGEHRPDLVVSDKVVVEIKSVERLLAVHEAQTLTYMRVLRLSVGLLMNFNGAVLRTKCPEICDMTSVSRCLGGSLAAGDRLSFMAMYLHISVAYYGEECSKGCGEVR